MHPRLRLRLHGCKSGPYTFPIYRKGTRFNRNSKTCVRRRFPLSTGLLAAVLRLYLTDPESSLHCVCPVPRVLKLGFSGFTDFAKTAGKIVSPAIPSEGFHPLGAQRGVVCFISFVSDVGA